MSSTHDWTYPTESPAPNDSLNTVLKPLTDRRRDVLSVLLALPTPVDERELAVHVAADGTGDPRDEVPDAAVRSARVDLRHVHLPKLEDAGLVEWNRDASTVAESTHEAYEDGQFRRFIEADTSLDAFVECLAVQRRRIVLGVLDERDAPVELPDLAAAVADRESDVNASSRDDVREVANTLHHVDLPKLEAAGLVERRRRDGDRLVSRTQPEGEDWFRFLD